MMNSKQIIYTRRANFVIMVFGWIVVTLYLLANLYSSEMPLANLLLSIGIAILFTTILTIGYVINFYPHLLKWFAIASITLICYYNLYDAVGDGIFRGLFIFFEALALVTLYIDKSTILLYSVTTVWTNIILYFTAHDIFHKELDVNSFFQFIVAFSGCAFLLYFITQWGEAMLQKSEERWQFALEGNGDGVWDWNIQTQEVFFSTQWLKMLGYADHELTNHLSEWESRVHPDDRSAVIAQLNQHLAGEIPLLSIEHRFQCKDGSYIWILCRGKVMTRDKDGKPLRMICSHSDITTRKRAEEQLEALQVQLIQKEKIASLAHLTAGVAHEMNSPLSVIKSNIELNGLIARNIEELMACPDNPWDVTRTLQQVSKLVEKLAKSGQLSTLAVERMIEIVRALEKLSNYEERDWQPFDLHELLENVLVAIYNEEHYQITIHRDYHPLPLVPCIPAQMSQVIRNLITNRIHAMNGRGELYITTKYSDDSIQIIIRDNGKGISKDQQSRIFDPGFAEKGNVIGMELGLAIAYNIVQNHRGEVLFESDAQNGSQFIVKLPFENSPAGVARGML